MKRPPMPPGEGWKENPGSTSTPKGTKGKKVDVYLFNRHLGLKWPADSGRPATRWTIIGSPVDIAWYRVA